MDVTLEDLVAWKKSLQGQIEELDLKIRPLTEALSKKREELKAIEHLIAIRNGSQRVEQSRPSGDSNETGEPLPNLSLVDAACRVLADAGSPLHYQDLMRRLRDSGYQIPGENPGANLIAHMVRDNRLVRCARGTYALRQWAESPDSKLRIMSGRRRRGRH